MQVEEFDFAIFGSGIDAALLGAELVKRHDCRVLLIRDHVNDYTLDHQQQFSMSGIADPDTIDQLASGLDNFHLHFGGKTGRACYERTQLALKVSCAERSDLLHFIEGALIACDMQSERKAARNGDEFLLLRDVIAPRRREALEYLHHAYLGVGMEVFDRTDFDQVKRLRDGRLNLKLHDKRMYAAHSVVLDDDLVDQYADDEFRQFISPVVGTKIALKTISKYTKPPAYYVDTGFSLFATDSASILAFAPMTYGAFVRNAKSDFVGVEHLDLAAQGAYKAHVTKDGAPILHFLRETKTWLFAGGGNVSAFLMPSISDQICNKSSPQDNKYWANRGTKSRKCADIKLMPPSKGDNNAAL